MCGKGDAVPMAAASGGMVPIPRLIESILDVKATLPSPVLRALWEPDPLSLIGWRSSGAR